MNIATTQSSIDYYQEQPRNALLNYQYNPSTTEGHELNPKRNIVKAVPKIKRSRSSKKSPTTLLSANVDNFRTLVQKYTGCQRANSSFFKMHSKGPINLSFVQENGKNDSLNKENGETGNNFNTVSMGSNTTSKGCGYNNNDDYYQETSQQVMPEDHQTFGHSQNNSWNSTVSDDSHDMLSVDDYFMAKTNFSW